MSRTGFDKRDGQWHDFATQCGAFRLEERGDEKRISIQFYRPNIAVLVFRSDSEWTCCKRCTEFIV